MNKINFPPITKQMDLIKRGVSEIIPEEELVKKLERSLNEGKPLNIKLGCDPSRPDLHIGHSVVLRKLAQFQSLGHQAILIVGDFTGMIGDPSGRNATRPSLSLKETREHGETYFQQASKILDANTTKIVYNSDWLGKMSFEDVIKLASKYTVARMLERDDFTKRYKAGEPISIHELLYPLAQAMDSVAIKSDVELGGTDQKFNLLVGRDIQRENGQEPQVILTMPLLVGTDGVEKMSKSYDNYIGISESPKEMYGKTLSIPDSLIYIYYELASDISSSELKGIKHQVDDPKVNPRDIKRKLARTLVRMYHSEEAAIQAEEEFDRIFIKKEVPDEVEEFKIDDNNSEFNILDLILKVNFAPSKGEARRLVTQGGVSIDGNKITDFNFNTKLKDGMVLKVGKRKFIKFTKEIQLPNFNDFLDTLKNDLLDFAKENLEEYRDDLLQDGTAFIENTKSDLARWTEALASGALSKAEFELLLKGKKNLAKMEALKQLGLSNIRLDKITDSIIDIIVENAIKTIP